LQIIKEKEVSFHNNSCISIVEREKSSKSNSDSGSLRVSRFRINGVPSIALYAESATQALPLALLRQGIKKLIIRTRNN
jgi:predicted 3-demethylubiquinone-9 3-methyltransferase (glyoxalase superfamily)